jgi:CxxC motif-containing protein (DUF1111 family)
MWRLIPAVLLLASAAAIAAGQSGGNAVVPTDPGPRGAPVSAGGFLANLTSAQLAQAQDGAARFAETENSVPGGLGPLYNSGVFAACAECHAQPAVGGSSPSLAAFPNLSANPQATVDFNADGATNTVPDFIFAAGPIREARFKYFLAQTSTGQTVVNPGNPDGGVHDLYSIAGRADAAGCAAAQPAFTLNESLGNVIFRIPTPVFGAGMIENIDDATIVANQQANVAAKTALGISGFPNRSGNDGTITRFGWKAQNKSLLMFAGEAYNVEIGVTNELFGTERPEPGTQLPSACKQNPTPEDTSNPQLTGPAVNSDIVGFAAFMRDLAPPAPAPSTSNISAGQSAFNAAGCVFCHTASLQTAQSSEASGLSNATANLFSDLLVHNMGSGLADGVSQGGADGFHFRTAPLWGVGQRVFFLHDGRTSDLLQAIQQHSSAGSEANKVIRNFNALTPRQQQNLLDFLRSL